jgi:DNA-binding response OmpR family regulator
MQVLKYLINKKSALVSKEELFTKIWKTSYVEDMNTLYTHMAYPRRAMEQDPSDPRLGVYAKREVSPTEGRRALSVGDAY